MSEKTIIPPDSPDNLKVIALVQAQFAAHWQPQDPRERIDFERELLYLVHLIYREATAPIVQRYIELFSAKPGPIIRVPAKPDPFEG